MQCASREWAARGKAGEESGEGLVAVSKLEQELRPESRCDGKHLSYVTSSILPAVRGNGL